LKKKKKKKKKNYENFAQFDLTWCLRVPRLTIGNITGKIFAIVFAYMQIRKSLRYTKVHLY
jgi:ABC-type Fe3+-siderophore transport system permease subunit